MTGRFKVEATEWMIKLILKKNSSLKKMEIDVITHISYFGTEIES
jgi:hypothetical protein